MALVRRAGRQAGVHRQARWFSPGFASGESTAVKSLSQQLDLTPPPLASAEYIRQSSVDRYTELFSSFRSLTTQLKKELQPTPRGVPHSAEHIEHITRLLEPVRINPKEWQQYTKFVDQRYTRTLVGYDEHFVMLMLCWEKGQVSPIHDHTGASCWVKCLDGEMSETVYTLEEGGSKLDVASRTIFGENEVAYMNDEKGVHSMGNAAQDEVAVTLHVYSPPYMMANAFDTAKNPYNGRQLDVYDVRSVSMAASNAPDNPFDAVLPNIAEQAGIARDASKSIDAARTESGSALPAPRLNLTEFVEHVQAAVDSNNEDEMDCSRITDLMKTLSLSDEEWERYVHFNEFQYTRNLILLSNKFSLMLMCWKEGQQTPPHSHGNGRHSWVSVLHGELTQRKLDSSKPSSSSSSGSHAVLEELVLDVSADAAYENGKELGLHTVGNHSMSDTAISLHLFTPAYTQLHYRTPAGEQKMLPVANYCELLPESNSDMTKELKVNPASGRTDGPAQFGALGTAWNCGTSWSSFPALVHMLDDKFSTMESMVKYSSIEPKAVHTISQLLMSVQFNPREWRQHVDSIETEGLTRIMLGHTENFMLVLTCWGSGQTTPIHDHDGSYYWMKVLEGSLFEQLYDSDYSESRCGTLGQDTVSFLDAKSVHRVTNFQEEPCYSLHLYAPPYTSSSVYKPGDVMGSDGGERVELVELNQPPK